MTRKTRPWAAVGSEGHLSPYSMTTRRSVNGPAALPSASRSAIGSGLHPES